MSINGIPYDIGKILNTKPVVVGRSKKLYRITDDYCLVELIPSLKSYTYKREDFFQGTDILRLDFFEIAASKLSEQGVALAFEKRVKENMYIAEVCDNPPFEIIVKNRAIGSTLIKYPELFQEGYEFIKPVVKFDYRTDPEDQPIAEDYIREYGSDPEEFKRIALKTNEVLKAWLLPLELWDFCIVIGQNKNGQHKIISEISPDGMRLRSAKNYSFDKDLFRKGLNGAKIIEIWTNLIKFLKENDKTYINNWL